MAATRKAGLDVEAYLRNRTVEFTAFLRTLVSSESPTGVPAAQGEVQGIVRAALNDVGYSVTHIPGRATGGHLYAVPRARIRGRPAQLLVGHTDTVWPLGTLEDMPVREENGRLYGPGSFDMKAGLAGIVFALRALHDLGIQPPATPVVFVNSDEEVGSPESRRWVERLARRSCRAFVLEPGLGASGSIKTARKGVLRFDVTLLGRAAHAGLEPDAGASAIRELGRFIRYVYDLEDRENGTTVNVGVVDGGIAANVVAPVARAQVDARVTTAGEERRVREGVLAFAPVTRGVSAEVALGIAAPPLERSPRNRRLWRIVRAAGMELGLDLEETSVGSASDGNTTSRFTATVDGLGAVGDGAHARHEHVEIAGTIKRCALLARLLLEPPGRAHGEEGVGRAR
jgi:glutamate carboxypeptidase